MSVVREVKKRVKAALAPAMCLAAISYFGYHLLEGDRGLRAYGRLSAELKDTQEVVDALVAERQKLERRVALLRAQTLDTDMLEEQARGVLGMVRKDDLVVILNN